VHRGRKNRPFATTTVLPGLRTSLTLDNSMVAERKISLRRPISTPLRSGTFPRGFS
jgi:hypothetical protein